MGLNERFEKYIPMVESEIRAVFGDVPPELSEFYGMMEYHLGWRDRNLNPARGNSGKRVRPVILLTVAEAVGGDAQDALPGAAAVELLHNFSLIHDDIEDNSPTRRHRPTVWAVWGVPQAINTGDGMYSLAYRALLRLQGTGVPGDRILRAITRFNETCIELTEGQFLDMSFEERMYVTTEDYLRMVEGKTAALLSTSAFLGALLGGADDEVTARYATFGKQLGIAFQIEDDILGIWGDEEKTGKPAASDVLEKKKTLPIIFGLMKEFGDSDDKPLTRIFGKEKITPQEAKEAARILDEYGARAYANTLAAEAHQLAMTALENTGVRGEAQDDLRALAEKLLGRES